MERSIRNVILSSLAILFLLAACTPAQAPTPDPQVMADQVATSVALTVASQNLDTAEAQPPATETPLPTATEAPVDTPTPVPPAFTPTAITLPTTVSSGGTTVRPEYACDVIFRRPKDNTVYRPNTPFDVKWTLVNTGSKAMRAGLDLKFSVGTQMITGVDWAELPELKPGQEYTVDFDAVAPSKEGTYVMAYMVEGRLCYPYVVIKVEK